MTKKRGKVSYPKQKKRQRKAKKRFYMIIKGKKIFIDPEIVERYQLKRGDISPFSKFKIHQERQK